ncbi:SLC13 family permease, partial [candidate division KSB1 bacterium]
ISSNLQGMAILIGDPPALILAEYLRMNFNDFFVYKGNPGLFFAVEISAIASLFVLYYFFRIYRQPVVKQQAGSVKSWFPTYMLVLMIILLSLAPLVDPEFVWLSGTICMSIAGATAVWSFMRYGGSLTIDLLKKYEYDTTFFLAGVFVLVKTFAAVGLVDDLTGILRAITGEDVLVNYLFIILFSMVISAFVDNVPYITMMIPVTDNMGQALSCSPYLLMYGLLIGSCLGGNITPIGAAANIVSVGILKKEGYETSFWDFVRIGLPFTLVATAAGALFIWFVWK